MPIPEKGYTMKLEVHERLAILSLLPKESDYAGLKSLRVARENLSFTSEEEKFIELRSATNSKGESQLLWDTQKALDAVRDIPLDEYVTSTIRKALATMEKQKKLTEEYLSIYEKFVVMYK
jgi:hypothetical protein